ncbi:MAG: hypothetical protein ACE369_02185 [Roseovarius sp.]
MKRLAALTLLSLTLTTHVLAEEGTIALRDLTADIVPTAARPGADRDFDGNGPILTLGTELTIGRGGRAIFASVIFSAREDGGDGTATSIRTAPTEVWRWQPSDGARFVSRILVDPVVTTRLRAVPGCAPIGCAIIGPSEDGGMILTQRDLPGYLASVTYLGDTTGDDISTDPNPHGDTSIRNISFDPIRVEFSNQLGG